MNAIPDDLTVRDILQLKAQQMLVVNPEYQRGVVWTRPQQKKLVDSVLRGYPIPLIYFHHIRQQAGKLVSERFEVIDGQQRINALYEFHEGAFKLFDPVGDAAEARFPEFIKKQACPWANKSFQELADLKKTLLDTPLRVVKIETHDPNEARDLFVRLQAGMPLNSQEKRDAWPGQFTDFILRLGGKPGLVRYPGHDFFNEVMRARKVKDRGKFRQLAAQIAVLYFSRRGGKGFCDINAEQIDDFYYENLGFNSDSPDAQRLFEVFDLINRLLADQKRPKVIGHEAIHLVLLVDTLMDDYTRGWETNFATAFDSFREKFALSKLTRNTPQPDEYWLRYGVHTRVNSDRADSVERRHEFFCQKMHEHLKPQMKDPKRLFGALEREIIYYRDQKKCAVCPAEVVWADADIHHIDQHAKGGPTTLENGVLVHSHCHPKGQAADEFAKQWKLKAEQNAAVTVLQPPVPDSEEEEDNGNGDTV
jgi:5-methylcytosine-specific restriction endonuclease McrA